jgi:hypothetical protein
MKIDDKTVRRWENKAIVISAGVTRITPVKLPY